jgi:hypothetical protein
MRSRESGAARVACDEQNAKEQRGEESNACHKQNVREWCM